MAEYTKAAMVYGLLLLPKNKRMFLRKVGGTLELPGGAVGEVTEVEALEYLVRIQTGYEVEAIEQVGPLYDVEGQPARAFDCAISFGPADDGDFLTLAEALPYLRNSRHLRIILDGYSIMEEPLRSQDRTGGVEEEGIFLDVIDGQEFLVEEVGKECRRWPRLNPELPRNDPPSA